MYKNRYCHRLYIFNGSESRGSKIALLQVYRYQDIAQNMLNESTFAESKDV